MSLWVFEDDFARSRRLSLCLSKSNNIVIYENGGKSVRNRTKTLHWNARTQADRNYRQIVNPFEDMFPPSNRGRNGSISTQYLMLFKCMRRGYSRQPYNMAYNPFSGLVFLFDWPDTREHPRCEKVCDSGPTSWERTHSAFGPGYIPFHQYATYGRETDSLFVMVPYRHSYDLHEFTVAGGYRHIYRPGEDPDPRSHEPSCGNHFGHLVAADQNTLAFACVDYGEGALRRQPVICVHLYDLRRHRWEEPIVWHYNMRGLVPNVYPYWAHKHAVGGLQLILLSPANVEEEVVTRAGSLTLSGRDVGLVTSTNGLLTGGLHMDVKHNHDYRFLSSYFYGDDLRSMFYVGEKNGKTLFGDFSPSWGWRGQYVDLRKVSVKKAKKKLATLFSLLLREGGLLGAITDKAEFTIVLNAKTMRVLQDEMKVPVEQHRNKIKLSLFDGRARVVTLCTKEGLAGERHYFVSQEVWEDIFVNRADPNKYAEEHRILDILRHARVVGKTS